MMLVRMIQMSRDTSGQNFMRVGNRVMNSDLVLRGTAVRLIRAAEDRQRPKRRAAQLANAARDAAKQLLAVKPLPALEDLQENTFTNDEWRTLLKHKLNENSLSISKLKNRKDFLSAMKIPAVYSYPVDMPDAEPPDEVVCSSGTEMVMLSEAHLLVEKIRALDPAWSPEDHDADGLTTLGVDVPTVTAAPGGAAGASATATPLIDMTEESPKSAQIRNLRAELDARTGALSNYRVRLEAAEIAVKAAKDEVTTARAHARRR